MIHINAMVFTEGIDGENANFLMGGGGGKGGCENVRPENNFSKNREREITFTEIREREIRKEIDNREYIYIFN